MMLQNQWVKNQDSKVQMLEGLICIINLKLRAHNLKVNKSKLGCSEAIGIVSGVVNTKLKMYLEDNPKDAGIIIDKINISKEARRKAQKKRKLITKKSVV